MWSTSTQIFYERIKQGDKIIGCLIVLKRRTFFFVIREKGAPQVIYECVSCSYNWRGAPTEQVVMVHSDSQLK